MHSAHLCRSGEERRISARLYVACEILYIWERLHSSRCLTGRHGTLVALVVDKQMSCTCEYSVSTNGIVILFTASDVNLRRSSRPRIRRLEYAACCDRDLRTD